MHNISFYWTFIFTFFSNCNMLSIICHVDYEPMFVFLKSLPCIATNSSDHHKEYIVYRYASHELYPTFG